MTRDPILVALGTSAVQGGPTASSNAMLDYWELTKSEINFLVAITAATGFWFGSPTAPRHFLWMPFIHTLLGTVLVAGGAATLNQLIELPYDAQMRRTAQRPLPSGRIARSHALWLGVLLSVSGISYLAISTNALASLLAALTLLSYLFLYTPLKRITPLCTLVGAIPGAAPPLIGWAAARGHLYPAAWVLFAIVFLWQFPHFMSIAWMYREDYGRAGYLVLPAGDLKHRFVAWQCLLPTVGLFVLAIVPALRGQAGIVYFAGALLLGVVFLYYSARFALHRSIVCARQLLFTSILYLPVLFALLALDKKMNAKKQNLERNCQTMLIAARLPRVLVSALLLSVVQPVCNAQDVEPLKFFRNYVGLHEDQITVIRGGKAVARIVESRTPDEVFVFGSVYVRLTPEEYLKLASDIAELRKLPNYLAIRKFSDPPQLSDLEGFTLEPEDIKQLKSCEPGHCDVQLPSEVMDAFKQSVNWSAPDATNQVNRLGQKMALEALQRYMQGGNAALGTYLDKDHPAEVAEVFRYLLSRSKALPVYLPELDRYLLDYPAAGSENIQSEIYWEKVNFGLKPTLRIVQAIVYRGPRSTDPAYAIAEKQLYASHYFETALDLTVCVRDQDNPQGPGFYLITLKGSKQAGLTGLKGGIVRKVAVDRTRSSLEQALEIIKQRLESRTN